MEHDLEAPTGIRRRLQPNNEHCWLTGLSDETQILMGIDGEELVCIRFNASGGVIGIDEREGGRKQLLAQWASEVITKPATIYIGEFEVPERDIALRQFPNEYQDFLDSPWAFDVPERSHYAVLINDWRERDRFVMVWNGEHWCCSDGLVHA